MNKKIYLVLVAIIIVVSVPLGLYFSIFNKSLSHLSQDWGAFGSFVGGVYSSAFGLASAIILVITYSEMRSYNRRQSNHLNRQKILDDIKILSDLLDKAIIKNRYIKPDRAYFFKWMTDNLASAFTLNKPINKEEIWERAIKRTYSEKDLFEDEGTILQEILFRLNGIDDQDIIDIAKVIVKGGLNPLERFWLECYFRQHRHQSVNLINSWPDFSQPPSNLMNKIV